MPKYYGNPKYIQQLEAYYNAKNAATQRQVQYVSLSCQDKVILAQQGYETPSSCCGNLYVVWNTWQNYNWDIDEHNWGTLWTL